MGDKPALFEDYAIRRISFDRFVYEVAMPNQARYKDIIAYAQLERSERLKVRIKGAEKIYRFEAKKLSPPQHVRITLENKAITKMKI